MKGMSEEEFIQVLAHVFVQWLAQKDFLEEYCEVNHTPNTRSGIDVMQMLTCSKPYNFFDRTFMTSYYHEYSSPSSRVQELRCEWKKLGKELWRRWENGEFN